MIYTLENEKIKVSISDIGAEMQSIVNKENSTEYLWQGEKKYWSGRAYNLFPICGRLYEGKYTYRGKEYEMGTHGFVRHSEMKVCEQSADTITFELRANEFTKVQYPFEFIYKVTYAISNFKIKTVITVENTDTKDLYFSIGAHPGFNVPLHEIENFDDYYLEFDHEKPIELIVMDLFYLDKTEPYPLKDGKIIELNYDLLRTSSKFFTNMCGCVTLKSKKSNSFIRVEYPNFTNLGLWHAPGLNAPYICIEPWTSLPSYNGRIDDLETKNQMTRLSPAKVYSIDFNIVIG